jgi:MFS family permease
MPSLYLIAFFIGILTVFFDLAYQSYLPALIDRSNLIEGNSKLQTSASAAEVGGPGVAGILVELLSAPMALLVDAISFLVSTLSLLSIRKPEPKPSPKVERGRLFREIAEGLQFVFGSPYLRALAGEAASYNLLSQAMLTVFVLYATRELKMSPGLYGFILAAGSVGALVGAILAAPVARRFGVGTAILGAMVIACAAPILLPLAGGGLGFVAALFMLALFTEGFGVAISNVHVVSLRQTMTPDHLLGRMNASYRLVIFGAIPLGSLLGGALGGTIGLRSTLLVSALALLGAPLWVWFSPVRKLRRLPLDFMVGAGEVD